MTALPKLSREQKVNAGFGLLATAGAITLATGGAALPVVVAGVIAESAFALVGSSAMNTVLNWVDRRGVKAGAPAAE